MIVAFGINDAISLDVLNQFGPPVWFSGLQAGPKDKKMIDFVSF